MCICYDKLSMPRNTGAANLAFSFNGWNRIWICDKRFSLVKQCKEQGWGNLFNIRHKKEII